MISDEVICRRGDEARIHQKVERRLIVEGMPPRQTHKVGVAWHPIVRGVQIAGVNAHVHLVEVRRLSRGSGAGCEGMHTKCR